MIREQEGQIVPRRPPVPIVVLTADAASTALRRCEVMGANGFLTKPISKEVLLHCVESHGSSALSFAELKDADAAGLP